MTRTMTAILLLLLVAAVLMLNTCKEETAAPQQSGCSSASAVGTYLLTPTAPDPPPAPYQLTDNYNYHSTTADGYDVNCNMVNYDDCPDQTNDSFSYGTGTGCLEQFFDAYLGDYAFAGVRLREYNQGTGPFATGTYTGPNGESGTFAFYEAGRTP